MTSRQYATAEELRKLLGPLHRALSKRAKVEVPIPSLTRAQAEVLRTLAEEGPLTSTQIGERLALARPTVSNLIKALEQQDMVIREPLPEDARSSLLDAAPQAKENVQELGRARLQVLQDAVEQLDHAERQALSDALPVLRRLLRFLQEG